MLNTVLKDVCLAFSVGSCILLRPENNGLGAKEAVDVVKCFVEAAEFFALLWVIV